MSSDPSPRRPKGHGYAEEVEAFLQQPGDEKGRKEARAAPIQPPPILRQTGRNTLPSNQPNSGYPVNHLKNVRLPPPPNVVGGSGVASSSSTSNRAHIVLPPPAPGGSANTTTSSVYQPLQQQQPHHTSLRLPVLSPLEWDGTGSYLFRDPAINHMLPLDGRPPLASDVKLPKNLYRVAVTRTIMSVAAAVVFGMLTWVFRGRQAGTEFFAGYLVEQSLSIDNLFVFIMLFEYFSVPLEYQDRVLTWGIVGAVVMRGIMIAAGVAVVTKFQWVTVLFAGILLFSAWKMLTTDDEEHDLANNVVVKVAKRMVGAVDRYDDEKFFTRISGPAGVSKRVATPLLLCLVCIELSDFVFAVDSIPAVLGVSQDPFVVYSSNIFAIMALRSIYTIIARAAQQLPYLKHAVALVLAFVGVKMLLEFGGVEISTVFSLAVVVFLLTAGVVLSLMGRFYKSRFKRKISDSENNFHGSSSFRTGLGLGGSSGGGGGDDGGGNSALMRSTSPDRSSMV